MVRMHEDMIIFICTDKNVLKLTRLCYMLTVVYMVNRHPKNRKCSYFHYILFIYFDILS